MMKNDEAISFEEARKILESHCVRMPEEWRPLSAATGFVSADDIYSPVSLPLFRNSAMDGYAMASADTAHAGPGSPARLGVAGEIKAGDAPGTLGGRLRSKRIMTGAPMPRGADAVLEKEKASFADGFLTVTEPIAAGRHVRKAGEELKKGTLALRKGTVLHPGALGFLASMGIERLRVFKSPKISLITTGSELVSPGASLRSGKIYNSNAVMLSSALREMKIHPILNRQVKDYPKLIRHVLTFALGQSDLVILTGGVSAGEYDLVKGLLSELGVATLFWKVRQKPGKPIYFGAKGKTLVFGLPGNPASVFTCFYEYVYPAIRLLMGHTCPYLDEALVALKGAALKTDPGRSFFLKGRVEKNTASPLKNQHSHMLSSLTETNAFLALNGTKDLLKEGDLVSAHFLPYDVC